MKKNLILSCTLIITVLFFATVCAADNLDRKPISARNGTVIIPLQDLIESQGKALDSSQAENLLSNTGTWTDSGVGPNVYYKGEWFTLSFTPSTYLPPGATITSVAYTWNVQNYRSDLLVYILNYAHYQNVSYSRSGITYTFNGDDAYCEFLLLFGVPGNWGEALNPPVYGAMNYIAVNYTY